MSEAMTDFRFEQHMSEAGREPGRERDALAEMADQIRGLEQAAELAAARVAKASEGLRYGPGTDSHSQLLADLGASLTQRVTAIRDECERLSRMLARATKVATRETAGPSRSRPAAPASEIFKRADNGLRAPEPFAESEPLREPEPPAPPRQPDRRRAPGQTTPEGVRLAATQMAVAGSTRSEIERVLRLQFGVRDADTALDEIFGTRSSEVR